MTTPTSTTPADWPAICAVATADEDATLCDRDDAERVAQDLADELREFVTIRDPISDRLLATIEPCMMTAEAREELADYFDAMRD